MPMFMTIIQGADEEVTCADDGSTVARFSLCGDFDDRTISLAGAPFGSVEWEQVTGGCTPDVNTPCPSGSCTFSSVGGGQTFSIDASTIPAGTGAEFRVRADGTGPWYYFEVTKSTITQTYVKTDFVCGVDGRIQITGLSSAYEFSIDSGSGFGPWQGPMFDNLTPGTYNVKARLQNTPGACEYPYEPIVIEQQDMVIEATFVDVACTAQEFTAFLPADNYTFAAVGVGTYTVQVETQQCTGDPLNGIDPPRQNLDTSGNPITIGNGLAALDASTEVNSSFGCSTITDVDITLNVTGGSAPYTFTVNGGPIQPSFTGSTTYNVTTAGTYDFIVTDSTYNNIEVRYQQGGFECTMTLPAITVTNVGVISGSATKVADRTCDGSGGTIGGQIDFGAASGGSGSGYVFSIDGLNFSATTSFTGLVPDIDFIATNSNCAASTVDLQLVPTSNVAITNYSIISPSTINNGGSDTFVSLDATQSYIFQITDANNCTYTEGYSPAIVSTIRARVKSGGDTQVCFGAADGSGAFLIDGFANNYTYNINGAPESAPQNAGEVSITVQEPASALALTATVTAMTCANGNLGRVVAQTTGGWGNNRFTLVRELTMVVTSTAGSAAIGTHQFRINGGPLQAGGTFTNLSPGGYSIEVVKIPCGAADGEITVQVTGGYLSSTTPKSYEVSTDNGVTFSASTPFTTNTFAFNTSVPGDYIFRVSDNEVVVTPASCGQTNNGIVTITPDATSGVPAYEINFNNTGWGTQATFSNLIAGNTYPYSVRDSRGCETLPASVTIPLDATPPPDATCGTANFTYILQDEFGVEITRTGPTASTTTTFANLAPGNYSIVTIDALGCRDIDAVTVIQTNLTVVPDPVTPVCDITGFSNTVEIFGGVGPFLIRLENDPAAPVTPNIPPRRHTFIGLQFGVTYTVEVTDVGTGCVYLEEIPPVEGPSTLDVTAGYYARILFTLGGDTRFPTIVGAFWEATYVVNTPGNYIVNVIDANGCTSQGTADVFEFISASGDFSTESTCNDADGAITIIPNGGSGNFDYELTGTNYFRKQKTYLVMDDSDGSIDIVLQAGTDFDGPIDYRLLDFVTRAVIANNASGSFPDLTPGSYEVEVVSTRNCIDLSGELVISEPPIFTITAAATPFTCESGSNRFSSSIVTATITSAGTPTNYRYSITGFENYQTSNTFEIVDNGSTQNITVYAIDDNGCQTTASVPISPPLDVIPSIVQTDLLNCRDPERVRIEVIVYSGSDPTKTTPIATGNLDTANNPELITGLTGGNFFVEVNFYGYAILFKVIAISPTIRTPNGVLDVTAVPVGNVSCNDNTGVIEATGVGGWDTTPYEYRLLQDSGSGYVEVVAIL
ncbi:hypothetical protein GQR58_029464 [Nymphon striatum]|nr:hypothetical protein GQR58_029464 [Nymphon striatum]